METEILKDLIDINMERINDYELIIKELKEIDVDLTAIIEGITLESRYNQEELSIAFDQLANNATAINTSDHTDIYKGWTEKRTSFTNTDRKAILANLVSSEEAVIKSYEAAVKSDTGNNHGMYQLISGQLNNLKNSYRLLQKYAQNHQVFD